MQQYIPWIISACSVLIAFLSYSRTWDRNEKTDIQTEAHKMDSIKESLLKANMKLDTVCATTNETRSDIKALNKDLQNLDTRVTVVERDLKTAFSRIDEIKGGN